MVYNVCQLQQACAGRAGSDQLPRCDHDVPRIRPCPAWHVCGHRISDLSGTAVARDFVEFPSQFNEHWATYPAVFSHYAKHYKTGAPMPAELAAKIKKAETFNQGYALTEMLAAAELDMQWHTLPASTPLQNPESFETEALKKTQLSLSYCAAALPLQLFCAHLGRRLRRRILRLSVGRDARRRRLPVVRRPRRFDPGEWRPFPPDDSFARQHRRPWPTCTKRGLERNPASSRC